MSVKAQRRRRRINRIVSITAVLLLAAGVVVWAGFKFLPRAEPRLIAMFDGGEPGTAEASQALQFASASGIDLVINYSVLNAPPAVIDDYLEEAASLGVGIVVSVKDLLPSPNTPGPKDLDPNPTNQAYHAQYGATTDEQIDTIVTLFDPYPAVWGYYIADELPEQEVGDNGLRTWLDPLKSRFHLVDYLSEKHVLSSYYYTPQNSDGFVPAIFSGTEQLMVDYYPYPDSGGQSYGPVSAIPVIAGELANTAGVNSWFAVQAFSYNVSFPDQAGRFGFPSPPPPSSNNGAPKAADMVQMAQMAMGAGVHNLAFFSYPAAAAVPGQLQEVAKAVAALRLTPEFQ